MYIVKVFNNILPVNEKEVSMKKFCIVLTAAVCIALYPGSARAWIWIDAIPPQIGGGSVTQAQVNTAVNQALYNIRTELLKYQSQAKMGRAFADASAYSAHAGTQRGYQGYDIVAITIGTMAGARVPSLATPDIDYFTKISKKLKYNGDIDAGASMVPWSMQIGLHLGHFNSVLDGLYVGWKFGGVKFTYQDYLVEGYNAGIALNYQIFKKVKAGYQVFVWRGVSIGTGLYYQQNNISMKHDLGRQSQTVGPAVFYVDPKLKFNIFTKSYVIPLEISTSIRLLWVLNLSIGGGIDFAIGDSKIEAKGSTWGYFLDPFGATGSTQLAPGYAVVYGKQKGHIGQWYLPKVTAGVGFSFGPVVIDVPVSYYFVRGLSVGLSIGFEW